MNTAAATQERADTAEPSVSRGQVAVLHPARLPFHPLIEERFGVDKASWKALTEAIYPNAKTTDSVVMALSYCRARKLDPFKRPVHIVPMWSSAAGCMVETVWPGISELRTTAFRTGQYAGKAETEFGPSVEKTFEGTFKSVTKKITITFPEWGRIALKRVLDGEERVFFSPKVYWLETYGRWGNTDVPNDMWAKRPNGQLEKCIEAAALRSAFPEEIGNDYAAEEMEGRVLDTQDTPQPEAAALANGTRPKSLTAALDNIAAVPQTTSPPIDSDAEEIHHEETNGPGHSLDISQKPAGVMLEEIAKLESVLGCLQWLEDNKAAIMVLEQEDRVRVDVAVLHKQDEFKADDNGAKATKKK